MATTIATISMVLLMVLLQNLYNWGVRLLYKKINDEQSTVLIVYITLLNVILTAIISQTIIHLNK